MARSINAKYVRAKAVVAGLVNYARLARKGRLKFWPTLHRLKSDRRGVTSMEFALVGGVFLSLVFLMTDAMWMVTVEMAMNDAAQDASRLGSLGTLPATGTREASIQAAMVTRASGLLNSSYLTVTMQSYGSVYNYGHHDPKASQIAGAGTSRQLVQYMVTYAQPLLTPFGIAALGGKTSFTHKTTIMVQNEPF